MTLLYSDSFEGFATGNRTKLDPNYNFTGNIGTSEASVFAPSAGNPSNRAASIDEDTTGGTDNSGLLLSSGGLSSSDTWIVGHRFRVNAPEFENTDSRPSIIKFHDSEADTLVSFYARAGTISVRANGDSGTLLGVADISLVSTVWYFVETKVKFHASAGTLTIRINEVEVLDLTGLNTAATATGETRPYEIFFGGSATAEHQVDDIYICDGVDATATQGQAYNDFLGDIAGKAIRPTGNGNSSQLVGSDADSTDNYLLVDEDGPDDDTTYVQTATVGEKDTYTFANLPSTPAQIEACVVKSYSRKTDAGSRTFVHVARVSATEADSAEISPSETYQFHQSIFTEDPDTTARWDEGGVNSAEFGLKLAS